MYERTFGAAMIKNVQRVADLLCMCSAPPGPAGGGGEPDILYLKLYVRGIALPSSSNGYTFVKTEKSIIHRSTIIKESDADGIITSETVRRTSVPLRLNH